MKIANNFPALTAFNSLNSVNKKLQKTINQLSTGLRINSASDDAAGFAVSEKMRSQISGLNLAIRNSQDGISFLQTAEGALGESNSMLQRMRELAVQASNDSLTSNDRQYLQLEIDELKKQIDRIADTTQFNKKRILDGSSGAVWSSSDKNLNAKINGGLTYIDDFGQKVSSEGNYRIEVNAKGGQAQIQKSNIITIAEEKSQTSEIQTPITEIQTVTKERTHIIDLSTMLDNSETPASSGDGWEFTTDTDGNTFLRIYADGKFNLTGTAPSGMYIDVEGTATDAKVFLNGVTIDNSATGDENTAGLPAFYIEDGANVNMYLSGNNTLTGGYGYAGIAVAPDADLTITSLDGDFSESGRLTATGGEGGAGIGGGNGTTNQTGTITINGGTIIANGGDASAGIGCGAYEEDEGNEGTIIINGGNITATGGSYSYTGNEVGHVIINGEEKIVYYIAAGAGIGTVDDINSNNMIITITGGNIKASGGTCESYDENGKLVAKVGAAGIGSGFLSNSGTIKIKDGLLDTTVFAQKGETQLATEGEEYYSPEHATYSPAEDIGHGTGGTTTEGAVNTQDTTLTTPSASEIPNLPTTTYTEEVEVITGYETEENTEEVTNYRTLKEISNFYNESGTFLISRPQILTITQGNGQSASITLYEHDTMQDVAKKINDAIADGLGQAKYADNKNKFCTLSDGTENSSESVYEKIPVYDDDNNLTGYEVNATMLIRSAIPGKSGEIYFSGDEDLLNALGLNTIKNSEEAEFTASVYDAHTGIPLSANKKSTAPEFKNLISPNVDVEIDLMSGMSAVWDETTKRFITSNKNSYSAVLHLKNSATVFQVGANEGEDFIIQLGDCSSNALGISNVNVLTRETASRAISIIDSAINKISSQRAKIGAYENALEHTMENLTITSTNLTSSESRIRDADMSLAMMNFVKYQILNQSGTSMLAQANQLPQSVLSLLQ